MPITVSHGAFLPVIALLAANFVGCAKTPSVEEYVQQAKTFHVKNEHKSAIIQLKNALAQQPDNGEARFLLGKLFNETNRYSFAEIELRRAQELQYDPASVVDALGLALAGQGKHEKGLEELDAFQQKQGELSLELLTLQGNLRLALGRQQDATASFKAALDKSAGFSDAYLGLAKVSAAAGDLNETLRQIDRAIEKSASNAAAWLFKGDALRSKTAMVEAEKAYRQAISINPNDSLPHLRLAEMYSIQGKLDAAQAEVDAVRKFDPQNLQALYQQAEIFLNAKKYAAADDTIQQVLKVAPEHLNSVLLAGATAHYLGKTELSNRHLTAYLKQFPSNAYARNLLGANLLRAGQPRQALDAVTPLLSQGDDVLALVIAGKAAQQNGEPVKARDYLVKAVSLAPKDAALRGELGANRLAAGDVSHGLADLEVAAQLPAAPQRVDIALILTYLTHKEYEKALAATVALEKKQPGDPAAFNMRGITFLESGKPAEARANFEKALALQPDYLPAVNNLVWQDLKEKNYDAGRRRLVKFLEKQPDNVHAMLALAKVAAIAGNDKERVSWLEKSVKTDPKAIKPHFLLASYHVGKNELQKALAIANELQAVSPENSRVLNMKGSIQASMGDRDGAIATYKSLVNQIPESPTARYRLALLQLQAPDATGARESLQKALELQPGYVDAEIALARLETQTGHYTEALKLAKQMRTRNLKSPLGAEVEGNVRMAQKDYDGALLAYDAALGAKKTPLLFIKAHNALMTGGKTKEADKRAAQWLKERPTDGTVRFYLADIDMREGRSRSAIEHYQVLLQREPDNVVALNNLATLYQKESDSRARATAERAYQLKPGEPTVLDTLGWIALQQGDSKRAVALLQEAVAKAPQSGTLRYHLAAGYEKSGDKAKAREILNSLLASSESFQERPEAVLLQGRL